MIDIENELFTRVRNAVKTEYPNALIKGEYDPSPASFPCITVIESENNVARDKVTSTTAKFAYITYTINVYSNKTNGKHAECRAIMKIIDSEMQSMGFLRTFLNPVPNINDATIYRLTARYRAIVSEDGVTYLY